MYSLWFTLKLLSYSQIPWTLLTPPLLARDPRGIPCVHGTKKKAPLWEPSTFSPLFKATEREQRLR